MRPRSRPCRKPRRSGAVLAVALVCLLIVMGMLAGMLKGALRERRQMRQERDLRQTELLVEAGADRAAFRLAADDSYEGETWNVPAEEIIGLGAGRVVIEVAQDASAEEGDDSPRQIRIVAEYPLGGETSIRRTRSFGFTPPSPEPESPLE